MIATAIRLAADGRRPSDASPPDPELSVADIEPVTQLPSSPGAFLRHYAVNHFPGRLALIVSLVVLAQTIDTMEAVALKRVIDGVSAAAAGRSDGADVMVWFFVLSGIWIGGQVFWRLHQMANIFTAPTARALVQKHLYGYLMGHSPRYFQDNFAGKLGQRIKQAGQSITQVMEILCYDAVRMLIVLSVSIVLLFANDPRLGGILLAWAAVYGTVSFLLARRCIVLSQAMSAAGSTLTGRLVDGIANADLVRGFARVDHERRHLGEFVDNERDCSRRLRWFLLMIRSFQSASVCALLILLCWISIVDAVAGRMTPGTFVLVFTLAAQVTMTVWNLSNQMLNFFEQIGVLSEALELVSVPHEITDPPGAVPLAVRGGAIAFEKVRFAHPDGKPLFSDFDLRIAPGEKVALVGPSGAGKSTLVKLLRRQYDPTGGRILIDGQDIARVTWDSVNAAIAEVPQQPGVFHRPIRENIRYGRLDADDAMVIRAAMDANCHDYIMQRPSGYDTIVGEQGIKLSGGERQRLAIARALLKDSRILVLDEATSALDSESEHHIQEALWRLFQGRTVIAIAHRLSTITGMDRIVVLDQGRIVEEGSHAALVARGGLYGQLWARQAGGFIAED
jgi:ATP-binding cassette subfamily B protein